MPFLNRISNLGIYIKKIIQSVFLTSFGKNWIVKIADSNRYWVNLAMSSDGTIQAAVVSGGQIYVSTDSGTTWTARDTTRSWQNIAVSSNGTIQAAVTPNQIYVSTNSGTTWTARGVTKNNVDAWSEIRMSTDGIKMTALSTPNNNILGEIWISNDTGLTWSRVGPQAIWYDIQISANASIQTAITTGQNIYVSIDSGATWTAKDSNRWWYGLAMSADGSTQITAGTADGTGSGLTFIYVSTDYGNTWTAKGDVRRAWYKMAMSSSGAVQTAITNGGQIYVSTDFGNTWAAKDSNRNWYDITMSSDGAKQIAVVNGGQIYVSTNFGNTWTARDSNRSWFFVRTSSDSLKSTALEGAGKLYISNSEMQLGLDINGTTAGDAFGRSIASNAAGSRIAISSNNYVQIYNWNGTSWVQLGSNIVLAGATSMSFSATGDTIVIGTPNIYQNIAPGNVTYYTGSVRVYNWNGTNWIQLGTNIDEVIDSTFGYGGSGFGTVVSINAAGNRILISAYFDNLDGTKEKAGRIRFYDWNGANWIQFGTTIDGEVAFDNLNGLSMNAAGNRVALRKSSPSAIVQVREWNGTSWAQLGSNIAASLSVLDPSPINDAGDIIAFGLYGNNIYYVQTYIWDGTDWTQLGTNINGQSLDAFGTAISMNAVGNKIIIGAYNDTSGGYVKIYGFNGTNWIQIGTTIYAEASGDYFGKSVLMNSVGDIVGIGAILNDVEGTKLNAGHVKIFQLN